MVCNGIVWVWWPVEMERRVLDGRVIYCTLDIDTESSHPQHNGDTQHGSQTFRKCKDIRKLFATLQQPPTTRVGVWCNLRTPQNIIQTSRAHQVPRVQFNITQSPTKNFIRSAITLLKILYGIHHTTGSCRRKVKYLCRSKNVSEENILSLFVLDSRYKLQLVEALITPPCSCNY